MDEVDSNFRTRVEALVAQIPRGRVMTYGQLAALCGNARAARIVGGIAHFGNPALPWQRVVNKQGGLAVGYPGGRNGHQQVLESEGVVVNADQQVDVASLLWWPAGRHPEFSSGPQPEQQRLLDIKGDPPIELRAGSETSSG